MRKWGGLVRSRRAGDTGPGIAVLVDVSDWPGRRLRNRENVRLVRRGKRNVSSSFTADSLRAALRTSNRSFRGQPVIQRSTTYRHTINPTTIHHGFLPAGESSLEM